MLLHHPYDSYEPVGFFGTCDRRIQRARVAILYRNPAVALENQAVYGALVKPFRVLSSIIRRCFVSCSN